MQLLEDKDLVNYGDMGKRIAALRERVSELLENRVSVGDPEIKIVERVVEKIVEVPVDSDMSEKTSELLQENLMLKKQIEDTDSNTELLDNVDEVLQENLMLKKKIADREKTIKELDFKLEMFRLAKNLREGAGINTKSTELKNIINEYIKEIDNSIASLNIE